ncbi:hypothetical protein M427DRAFT_281264 [Gonapodya prolifera JEL478]|uniref:Uncharacterized protein n=1 Tax=Gonapodya prolifera (strain JEL478) TaxID=1344416 RepID=A0A139AYV9_GONPJ|nr:hypothetical protein M427DRAFT_281264 [Gonapodya prolifera JEL478]|eukprot:KXS21890.1 hypothetical protein M427DRAFT_281264 [Gonapodya prolifera JEL478]
MSATIPRNGFHKAEKIPFHIPEPQGLQGCWGQHQLASRRLAFHHLEGSSRTQSQALPFRTQSCHTRSVGTLCDHPFLQPELPEQHKGTDFLRTHTASSPAVASLRGHVGELAAAEVANYGQAQESFHHLAHCLGLTIVVGADTLQGTYSSERIVVPLQTVPLGSRKGSRHMANPCWGSQFVPQVLQQKVLVGEILWSTRWRWEVAAVGPSLVLLPE